MGELSTPAFCQLLLSLAHLRCECMTKDLSLDNTGIEELRSAETVIAYCTMSCLLPRQWLILTLAKLQRHLGLSKIKPHCPPESSHPFH